MHFGMNPMTRRCDRKCKSLPNFQPSLLLVAVYFPQRDGFPFPPPPAPEDTEELSLGHASPQSPRARCLFPTPLPKTQSTLYITTPELLAIRCDRSVRLLSLGVGVIRLERLTGQSSAASLPTGPVMAEPFISPLGLT